MRHAFFQRCALIAGIAAVTSSVWAQAPNPAPQTDKARTPPAAAPRAPSASKANPHGGPRREAVRVVPAADLAKGEIQVIVTANDFDTLNGIEGQDVQLFVNRESIELGNSEKILTERLDPRGRVTFPPQPMETDHVYRVSVNVGGATFSSHQFQFRSTDAGLRVVLPVFPATDSLDGLLLLSRAIVGLIPQDDLFSVEVLWRVENYSDKAWIPKDVFLPLPEGFRALNIRKPQGDARFEADGDRGVKFAGTFAPGQHDLNFRFHFPTEGQAARTLQIPTGAHLGSLRVILDGSPSMDLKVEGFPEPEVTRNQDGQRRLVSTRDFLKEKKPPSERVQVEITGIPTPPAGRTVAVGVAGALALFGLGQGMYRRRTTRGVPELSKEDRERAGELLLEELISLERAFEQGAIGRKTHEQAKRQLLEAYARLGAHSAETSVTA